mmetsp:Transcript_31758/g.48713  ORF Transcript_31758/g.48713 Transcript_31758/m.48713 type:complete len:524 (-) Transcript_31758:1087-2658(-)
MKIRQHPKIGVYVEGVKKVPVSSYEEIENQIDNGTKNRTIGSTNMNATSSRAHTVTTISFKQIIFDKGTGKKINEKSSDINLIDLAGSERAESTGATGDRLKEGANINKSLMILGKVISELAKKAEGKKAAPPFRESSLTFLLQNALGGNTKTSMIAALSPANINHDETLSTLRYAWQVKAIKNQAKINEDPQEKLIRELREELERIKKQGGGGGGEAVISDEMKAEMEEQKKLLEQMQREKDDFENKLRSQQEEMEKKKREQEMLMNTPHLKNINADPSMTGMIKKAMLDGDTTIGKETKDYTPDLPISGVGIANRHCVIQYNAALRESQVVPNADDPDKFQIKVNGQAVVNQPVQLMHGDRLLVGTHHYYLFVDPNINNEETYTWELAMKEANGDSMKNLEHEAEMEKMKKQAEEMRLEKEEREKEMQEKVRIFEEEKARQQAEMEKKQQEIMQNLDQNKEGMKEMEERLAKEKEEFQNKLKEQQAELERQREVFEEEQRQKLKNNLEEQQKLQQFEEIDR